MYQYVDYLGKKEIWPKGNPRAFKPTDRYYVQVTIETKSNSELIINEIPESIHKPN